MNMQRILESSLVMLALCLVVLPAGALTVTGISPGQGLNTGTVFITNLSGSDFTGDTSARLVMSGEPNITGQYTTVVDPARITCVFDLTGKQAGSYDVVVLNTAGEESALQDGFVVLNPEPVLTGIVPGSGINSGTVRITDLSGSYFLPGASVSLSRAGQPPVAGTDVIVSPSGVRCSFDLSGVATGAWDVVLVNPDGQSATLPGAFTVRYPPPVADSITPSSGKTNEVVGITNLAGSGFLPGAGVILSREDGSSIAPVSNPIVEPTKILCFFDLNGKPAGKWDVLVTNPDGQWSRIDDGFTVYYPQPPSVTGIWPSNAGNIGTVQITDLAGTGFKAGASVVLARSGEQDIPGTMIDVESDTRITGQFNLAGTHPGAWDVRVTNNDGQSATLPGAFTVTTPAPIVSAIVPASGLNGGVVAITNLSGLHFLPGATVTFSRAGLPSIAAGLVQVDSPERIECIVDLSGAAAGVYDVTVANPDGQSSTLPAAFNVSNPAPSLTALTPATGAVGSIVTLRAEGAHFLPGCTGELTRTGKTAIPFVPVSVSSTRLNGTLDLSGAEAGLWSFTVTNPDGQTSTLYDGFIVTYPSPTVTGVTPAEADNSGITGILVLKGTGFFDDAAVKLVKASEDPIPAKGEPVVENETTILCFFDLAGARVGPWTVVVTNTDNQSGTLPSGFFIRYPSPPAVTSIAPSRGENTGVLPIDISGSGFRPGAQVRLKQGGTEIPAINVVVAGAPKITCEFNLSGRPTGTYDLVVENNDGQKAVLPQAFQVVNPAPSVQSITPATGINSGTVAITNLAGSGFLTGASVRITKLGEADILASGISVVNPGKITCSLNLAGARAGLWNVVVRNADGQNGTLPNAFTVEYPAPTVTGISPDKAPNNGIVTINAINGSGFLPGAMVQLTRAGQSPVTATNVNIINPSRISCLFDLTGRTTGMWTVVVTNSDGKSGSLPTGFSGAGIQGGSQSGFEVTSSPPVPDFSGDPTTGTAPLTVQFRDLSTNDPFLWAWNFGDGTTVVGLDQKNPVHTYQEPGIYNVLLQATNRGGSAQITKRSYIVVVSTPIANFTAAPVSGNAPLVVRFSDKSDGDPTRWLWKSSDGQFSSEKNPYFVYKKPGTYTVSLTVYNPAGSDTLTRENLITVSSLPVAAFTANRTAGPSPLAVQFTDASTGSPTSWTWTFGDDGISHQQNPVHVFTTPGTYSIQLKVANGAGNSTELKKGFITVDQPLAANFTYTTSNSAGSAPLTVAFNDRSTGEPTTWSWRFGDGYITNEKNPIHTYLMPGTYEVTLTVTSVLGTDSMSKTIVVKSPLKADFYADPTTGSAPLTVTLHDTSIGEPTSRYWVLSKGIDVVLLNPGEKNQVYTLNEPGVYTVAIRVADAHGSVSELEKKDYITVLPFPPV